MSDSRNIFDDLLLFTIDWRNRHITQQLIDSLAALPVTLLIIINDQLPEAYSLPEGATLKIEIYRTGRNIGFAAACNQAIEIAEKQAAQYLLHMNNDLQLESKAQLIKFISIFKAQSTYALASPTIQSPTKKIEFAGSHPLARLSSALIIANKQPPLNREQLRKTQFINGACFIARMDVLQKIDGFDEHYFAYREEHDLSFRIKQQGGEIGYLPVMCITHHLSSSSDRDRYFKELLITRGQLIFMQKNLTGAALLLFILIFSIKTTLKGIAALLAGKTSTLRAIKDALKNQLFKHQLTLQVLDEKITLD